MHRSFSYIAALIFVLFFACNEANAQQSPIKPAFEFPTKEVYDLYVDRRGFLWIASDIGVSRFDGINCVHFTSPHQISLGCANLLEDSYGRIWFNNFNGQIFYIEHETVSLVKGYNYKAESNFPRMVMFHDQLIATSDNGLFVLDTKTLANKYIAKGTYTGGLAVVNDQVLVLGAQARYTYRSTGGLTELAYDGDGQIRGNVYQLASTAYRDTVYMMENPTGTVRKFVIVNDTLKQCGKLQFNSFINTISITPDNRWVNANNYSYSLTTGEKISGFNVSDIVTDKEGNRWFSSLYHGLLIQYKKDVAEKTVIADLDKDDFVVSIRKYKDQLLMGTQKGLLLLYDPATKTTGLKMKLSPKMGSINNITAVGADDFIVATSISTYKINIPGKKLTELATIKTVKQLCYDDRATYIASTSGLYVIPHVKSDQVNQQIDRQFGRVLKYDSTNNYFYLRVRVRTVAYARDQAALFVAFKNSLYKIDKNGKQPFLFDGEQVYAGSLAYINHRLYIGTISNGMLIVGKDGTKHISVQNGLFSKSIFKIKPVDQNLWILGSGPLQIFDTQKMALANDYKFPNRSASEVFDLDGAGKVMYLATSSGLDQFPLIKNTSELKLNNYLLYLKVNNKVIAGNHSRQFTATENNLLFNIGVPAYLKAQDIYIKYSLVTPTDSTWLTTEPGERSIHFSSLMPGKYLLKAIAVDPRLGMAGSTITYAFTIAEPWWGGLGFKIAVGVVLILIVFYGYVTMLLKRLALKKEFEVQQRLILAERQRISAEMHDEIGSGVFAIQSLANKAAKQENAAAELTEIKSLVVDLSDKIREVIWSTNVGNDNLENLIYYTFAQIERLFQHSSIKLVSDLPDDIIDLRIDVASRRSLYLLVKEVVHNAIKHSKADTIELKMFTDEQTLFVSVIDNGIGIDFNKARSNGMGLGNIKSRVGKLNGQIVIENLNGAQVKIQIPLNSLKVVEFDKKISKWQLLIANFFKLKTDRRTAKDE